LKKFKQKVKNSKKKNVCQKVKFGKNQKNEKILQISHIFKISSNNSSKNCKISFFSKILDKIPKKPRIIWALVLGAGSFKK
jgi:hypothetical protein